MNFFRVYINKLYVTSRDTYEEAMDSVLALGVDQIPPRSWYIQHGTGEILIYSNDFDLPKMKYSLSVLRNRWAVVAHANDKFRLYRLSEYHRNRGRNVLIQVTPPPSDTTTGETPMTCYYHNPFKLYLSDDLLVSCDNVTEVKEEILKRIYNTPGNRKKPWRVEYDDEAKVIMHANTAEQPALKYLLQIRPNEYFVWETVVQAAHDNDLRFLSGFFMSHGYETRTVDNKGRLRSTFPSATVYPPNFYPPPLNVARALLGKRAAEAWLENTVAEYYEDYGGVTWNSKVHSRRENFMRLAYSYTVNETGETVYGTWKYNYERNPEPMTHRIYFWLPEAPPYWLDVCIQGDFDWGETTMLIQKYRNPVPGLPVVFTTLKSEYAWPMPDEREGTEYFVQSGGSVWSSKGGECRGFIIPVSDLAV